MPKESILKEAHAFHTTDFDAKTKPSFKLGRVIAKINRAGIFLNARTKGRT